MNTVARLVLAVFAAFLLFVALLYQPDIYWYFTYALYFSTFFALAIVSPKRWTLVLCFLVPLSYTVYPFILQSGVNQLDQSFLLFRGGLYVAGVVLLLASYWLGNQKELLQRAG